MDDVRVVKNKKSLIVCHCILYLYIVYIHLPFYFILGWYCPLLLKMRKVGFRML